eukprot:TRINITY_DN87767_c0_g1_i1.p1 TRINITY_DN87767_c0_g1~~TRINITY_DN87767_c0_g1_i1.p1  ORF type:complete len:687 (-),score=78.48 TRINITY_DN87767_c0_g1_i1:68-2077(-)
MALLPLLLLPRLVTATSLDLDWEDSCDDEAVCFARSLHQMRGLGLDDECWASSPGSVGGDCALSALQRHGVKLMNASKGRSLAELPPSVCINGSLIENSNRVGSNACYASALGEECSYLCDDGYIAIGRHVCQSLEVQGSLYFNHTFFGGKCYKLCVEPDVDDLVSEQCISGSVPFRWLEHEAAGNYCLRTLCKTEDAALRDLAEGNYALWRLARSDHSGVYVDHVSLNPEKQMGIAPGQNNYQGATDVSGLGLMMECIADAMQWINRSSFLERVNLTLRAFANKSLPGDSGRWNLPRSSNGWLPRYFNVLNGVPFAESVSANSVSYSWSIMATGLFYSGAMFVRTYLSKNDDSLEGAEIINLVDELVAMVKWDTMMCMQALGSAVVAQPNSPYATGIPYLQLDSGECKDILWPTADGSYAFNEMMSSLWLAYEFSCHSQPAGNCTATALQTAWQAWQSRRHKLDAKFLDRSVLSQWSCYIAHFPFYTVNPFVTDPAWRKAFKGMWIADWEDYNSSAFYAGDLRYGLGAGPTIPWCSGGETYTADKLETNPNKTGCRMWSPYCTAGYMPNNPKMIQGQLFQLLAQGESVLPLFDVAKPEFSGHTHDITHILGRKSLLVPEWNESDWITMVDLSSELLGLSTEWLGEEFFISNTDHFSGPRAWQPRSASR